MKQYTPKPDEWYCTKKFYCVTCKSIEWKRFYHIDTDIKQDKVWYMSQCKCESIKSKTGEVKTMRVTDWLGLIRDNT